MGIARGNNPPMVLTASGKLQKFNPRKIYRTCLRAGADRCLANQIVEKINASIYDGISTKKILQMVLKHMRQELGSAASKYDLKSAIMRMGPTGFAFETFLAEVLEYYGYKTYLRRKITGLCVEHEIDIVLEKDGHRSMVEVKFHNAPGIYTGLKEALYTHSRFLDLKEGHEAGTCERFDEAWLATNTRASPEARKYAAGKGIYLLGWKHPRNGGIEKMIEDGQLYPVTVLHTLKSRVLSALYQANMMLAMDLAQADPDNLCLITGLPKGEVESLTDQARDLLGQSPQPITKGFGVSTYLKTMAEA